MDSRYGEPDRIVEPAMNPAADAAALAARDRSEGWALIAVGVPFAVVSFCAFAFLLFGLLFLVGVPPYASLAAAAALALAAVIIDTWRHPEERWKVARYRLVDGATSGPSLDSVALAAMGASPAVFAGMPLNAAVNDPGNLAQHGGMLASGCANLILGGPRLIRRGLTQLTLARLRTDPRVLGEARSLLEWVAKNGPVEQGALAVEAARRNWVAGLSLVMDLNALRWTLENGAKRAVVREAST